MTEQEVDTAITAAIKTEIADKLSVAKMYRQAAVMKIGRLDGVDFNRRVIETTLTAGTKKYDLNVGILKNAGDILAIEEIFCTDQPSERIYINTTDEFGAYARGSTVTGRPERATLYADKKSLEFWPTPDQAYPIWLKVKRKLRALADIPDEYHDVVIAVATAMLQGAANPQVSTALAAAGLKDITDESLVGWMGDHIRVDRLITGDYKRRTGVADSYNLTGE